MHCSFKEASILEHQSLNIACIFQLGEWGTFMQEKKNVNFALSIKLTENLISASDKNIFCCYL